MMLHHLSFLPSVYSLTGASIQGFNFHSNYLTSPYSLTPSLPRQPMTGNQTWSPRKPLSTKKTTPVQGKRRKNVKNFVCEVCFKRLPSRREYEGHMNGRHLGKKPFSCDLCGKRFAYSTSLPVHRKICLKRTMPMMVLPDTV